MSEENEESGNRVLKRIIQWSEYILESNEKANIFFVACVILGVLLALGIGMTLTNAAAPVF